MTSARVIGSSSFGLSYTHASGQLLVSLRLPRSCPGFCHKLCPMVFLRASNGGEDAASILSSDRRAQKGGTALLVF